MFHTRLREVRESRCISRTKLADTIGVSVSMVGHYETGLNSPSAEALIKIAKILNVSVDYLLGLSEEKHIKATHESVSFVRPIINGKPASDRQLEMLTKMMGFARDVLEDEETKEG
ncbi:MAG: hypothetical protein CML24_00610 [Rhizobiales bacterium]|nr:hypothetical protein [Hyphomicrobiales bacterium]